jgi:hypothetical protein
MVSEDNMKIIFGLWFLYDFLLRMGLSMFPKDLIFGFLVFGDQIFTVMHNFIIQIVDQMFQLF